MQRGNVWAPMDSCHPFGVLDRIRIVHTRVNTRACIMITPSGFPCAVTGVRIPPYNAHTLSPQRGDHITGRGVNPCWANGVCDGNPEGVETIWALSGDTHP